MPKRIIQLILGIVILLISSTHVWASVSEADGSSEVSVETISDYQSVSAALHDEEDYFGSIIVDQSSTQILKDGETESFSEEFDVSESEAGDIVRSEKNIEEFLEHREDDTIYDIHKNENDEVEITAPYQTKRLIVDRKISDCYGAVSAFYNKQDRETILEFETEEETKNAYEKICTKYGASHCFADEIVYLGKAVNGVEMSPLMMPYNCCSWGNAYMKMDLLKKRMKALGYKRKITVAVIDSGVNKANPLFRGKRILPQSRSFVRNSKSIRDSVGHGSHVAGIIADATPANVKILALKVTDSHGRGTFYNIKNAMRYAVRKKVQVINFSMVFTEKRSGRMRYLNDIIRKAYYKGIPVCTAAGNEGRNVRTTYPANSRYTFAVAAINPDESRGYYYNEWSGKKFYYSNYGNKIDFAAPGTDVISAGKGGNYYVMTGTSMAAPHLTAAVAYLKMMKPNLSVSGIRKELKLMSVDLGKKGKDSYYGWGCPSLEKLLEHGITYSKDTVKPVVGQAAIRSLKNRKKGIKITWTKVKKAQEYKIYRKGSGGKFKLIAKVPSKKRSWIDKKVKRGKKYTYFVRAFRYGISGKKSAKKSVLCVKK